MKDYQLFTLFEINFEKSNGDGILVTRPSIKNHCNAINPRTLQKAIAKSIKIDDWVYFSSRSHARKTRTYKIKAQKMWQKEPHFYTLINSKDYDEKNLQSL